MAPIAAPGIFGMGIWSIRAPRDRADPVGRNLIVRELRAPAAVRIAGRRVVNPRRCRAEVAVAERGFRHVALREAAAVVAGPDEIAEEEQLVAFDRPAKRKARLHVLGVCRSQRRKRVARHRRLGVAEAEDRSARTYWFRT